VARLAAGRLAREGRRQLRFLTEDAQQQVVDTVFADGGDVRPACPPDARATGFECTKPRTSRQQLLSMVLDTERCVGHGPIFFGKSVPYGATEFVAQIARHFHRAQH
jgi:hypothetical protein